MGDEWVKCSQRVGKGVHSRGDFVIRLDMQITECEQSVSTPVPPELRRNRVAWQAKRLLTEAAGQLGDLVRLSSATQQPMWVEALRTVEQVSAVLDLIARPPLRSRRYRYSLDWRRKFASLLRERREERGLTRQQIAERSKLSLGTIRNIETLRVHPEIDTIERLLAVAELGLSWSDLGPIELPQK